METCTLTQSTDTAKSSRQIVGLSGNWNRPSRTRTLVKAVLDEIESRELGQTTLFDFVDTGVSIGSTFSREDAEPSAKTVLDAVAKCDVLVVGSSVYKGSYTGIFKHFFDLYDREAFAGKPVLITATGAAPYHESILDYHLRPLFLFFDARVASRGLYALTDDFASQDELKQTYKSRVARSVDELAEMLQRVSS
jgi:FMN reductase